MRNEPNAGTEEVFIRRRLRRRRGQALEHNQGIRYTAARHQLHALRHSFGSTQMAIPESQAPLVAEQIAEEQELGQGPGCKPAAALHMVLQ